MKKNFSYKKKTHRPTPGTRQRLKIQNQTPGAESFMLKVYVCLILIIACLAVSKMESRKAVELSLRLKNAIDENITVEDAKELGEMGIEKIEAFKNGEDGGTDGADE